jgi:DNA mismatch repair protein MutL
LSWGGNQLLAALIQILDSQAANQIAAGEVVERPVSVVKELIENALDAGAKQIEITIEGSGVELIRIRDDGRGISAEDLPRAVLRHATSKIRTIDDLNHLRTLGFRGEALPSIASVSKMEITTRMKDEISGRLLRIEGGNQSQFREIGCPPGTTVTIEDLFFNTPARRKFLKSTNTEFGLISDVIGRLSLARPDVAFTLRHPKVVVLQTPGRGRLIESIGAVLGQNTARRVLPISFELENWRVEGYISPPDLVRSTRHGETLIVNDRIIRSNVISRAIQEGYHTLIPNKLYPIIILNLQIPPDEYDVNVHPTKMEIRFHQEKRLTEFITDGVRKTLLNNNPVAPFESKKQTYPAFQIADSLGESAIKAYNQASQYTLKFPTANSSPNPSAAASTTSTKSYSNSLPHLSLKNNQLTSDLSNQFTHKRSSNPMDLKAIISINESGLIHSSQAPADSSSTEISENAEPFEVSTEKIEPIVLEPENPLLSLRPLGQVFKTFILSTDEVHLVLIDQHAAHERINYERLLHEHRTNPGSSQALLIPLSLEFTPAEEQALLEHIMLLHDMGFVLEQFGTRTYLLRGIPAYSGPYQGEKLLQNFLDQVLLKQIPPTFDQLLEEWIYMLACKESIKAKESLSLLEMEQLLIQLSKTENPYTCPHGRPTMVRLTREELERRFYRT